MSPELAKYCLEFLARVDLKGAEAPAIMQVVAALNALAYPTAAPPVDKPE